MPEIWIPLTSLASVTILFKNDELPINPSAICLLLSLTAELDTPFVLSRYTTIFCPSYSSTIISSAIPVSRTALIRSLNDC